MAQVWFDSVAELVAGVTSTEGRTTGAALIEDELNFIDHAASAIWIADEREIDP